MVNKTIETETDTNKNNKSVVTNMVNNESDTKSNKDTNKDTETDTNKDMDISHTSEMDSDRIDMSVIINKDSSESNNDNMSNMTVVCPISDSDNKISNKAGDCFTSSVLKFIIFF